MSKVHAIILTYNEERHIARCISSLTGQCTSVTLIDSGSTDRTADIAKNLGSEVLINPFVTHASQVNFAIDALAKRDGWLLRIDADEVLHSDNRKTLMDVVASVARDVDGLLLERRIHFLGRRIRYGSIEPSWQLRLWRIGKGRCEKRWMDEHIFVDGTVEKSGLILSDINLNSLSWWTAKHNNYASLEAIDILNQRYGFMPVDSILNARASKQAQLKRLIKERIYLKIPTGSRALAYFLYRYIFRLGFLDSKAGLYFHVLQGLWYRTLVDAKVNEIEQAAKVANLPIIEAIRDRTGIDPMAAN